jgi:hypothetical protein
MGEEDRQQSQGQQLCSIIYVQVLTQVTWQDKFGYILLQTNRTEIEHWAKSTIRSKI